jgi:SAM-dependent methyltransferase
MRETERIKSVYEKRDKSGKRKLYSLFNPGSLFAAQQRERWILRALSRAGIADLAERTILDIGCGNGGVLRDFLRYGAQPSRCFGVDLLQFRVDEARLLSPNIDFRCQNAETLPYEDASFDIVICFTVFTSILDTPMKRNLAQEMLRVLKKDGVILWYDYHINNPRNPDVRAVKKAELRGLFPGCEIDLARTTLAPPLARTLARLSWLACYLLEKLKIFNTHYVGTIRHTRRAE